MNRTEAKQMMATVRRAARSLRSPSHQDFDDLVQVGCLAVLEHERKHGAVPPENVQYREAWTDMTNHLRDAEVSEVYDQAVTDRPSQSVLSEEEEETEQRKRLQRALLEQDRGNEAYKDAYALVSEILSSSDQATRTTLESLLVADQHTVAELLGMSRFALRRFLQKIGAQFLASRAYRDGSR